MSTLLTVASLICAAALSLNCAAQAPPDTSTLAEAVTGGKLLFSLRPRLELVDQDGKDERARAFTLRTLLGWQTKPWHGLAVTAQAIDVSRIGSKRYNDEPASSASARFPTVADPENTDVNQLFLDYTGVPHTRVRLGKQSIKLDNVCFVGNAEFRQVMQVFNGVMIENKSLARLDLLLGHLVRIKNTSALQRETRIDILHADYKLSPTETLTAFGYFQDQPVTGANTGFADNSNAIVGLRADGARPLKSDWRLLYTAEYAQQDDYASGDARIDADYMHFGVGPAWRDYFVRLDYELRGSNDGRYGFQTPLGTNHLFQGWADQFATVPKEGLRDVFVSLGAKLGRWQLYGEYHRFKSDFGSIDFGDEIDVSLSYPLLKQLTGKLEYADYRAGDLEPGKRDVSKVWVTLLFAF